MIRINRRMAERGIEGIEGEAHGVSSFVLTYTYVGNTEEVFALKKLANWWARLGKSRLARALAQLAHDLEDGIAMGAIAPGDTVYHIV